MGGALIGHEIEEASTFIGGAIQGTGTAISGTITSFYVYCTSDDNDEQIATLIDNIAEAGVRISDMIDTQNQVEEAGMDESVVNEIKRLIEVTKTKKANMEERLDALRKQ